MEIDINFWKNKRVFVTGHNGFKGSWLSLWLTILNCKVFGFSLQQSKEINLCSSFGIEKNIDSHKGNICNKEELLSCLRDFQPDIVLHLAAQSIVKISYENPIETYLTNIIGTANILDSAREIKSIKSILVITSDKCYENDESGKLFTENDKLGGYDPYSSSKGCAELVTSSFRNSFFKKESSFSIGIATARAGNIIGGGDMSPNRLIPDIMRSMNDKTDINIRSPNSIRPWQHVLEPLKGYLILSQRLFECPDDFSTPWNFGPDKENFLEVEAIVKMIVKKLNIKNTIVYQKNSNFHESKYLKLDNTKSKKLLNWKPKLSINETIALTAQWYNYYKNSSNTQSFSEEQIIQFDKL